MTITYARRSENAEAATANDETRAAGVTARETEGRADPAEQLRRYALLRRRRRKPALNEPPAKMRRRVPGPPLEAPPRPKDWRKVAIRAAWAVLDWHTLKACGEIDKVPEP